MFEPERVEEDRNGHCAAVEEEERPAPLLHVVIADLV